MSAYQLIVRYQFADLAFTWKLLRATPALQVLSQDEPALWVAPIASGADCAIYCLMTSVVCL